MTKSEYNNCCAGMEKLTGRKDEMKHRRSVCLKQMQQLGIDTTDWARVDNFCRHPRIAGKPFARITFDELPALQKKLRTIARKGGLKPAGTTIEQQGKTVCIVLDRHILIN